jgi:hypothetical protein
MKELRNKDFSINANIPTSPYTHKMKMAKRLLKSPSPIVCHLYLKLTNENETNCT